MAIDDEELLQLFSRTSMLVRREQHAHGRDDRREGPPPPRDGRGPYPGPPPPPPDGRGPRGPEHGGRDERPQQQGGRQAQDRVLAMLSVSEGLSQKDLAFLMGIRPQSLTETLLQLEAAGCIERRKNPNDGRVINVYLTDHGRERANQAAKNRRARAHGAFAALDEHDKEELARILTKLSEALED